MGVASLLDFLEILAPPSHVIVPTLKIGQLLDSMAFTGCVYVPDSHGSTDPTSHSAQKGAEVTDLSVIHHHTLGSGV